MLRIENIKGDNSDDDESELTLGLFSSVMIPAASSAHHKPTIKFVNQKDVSHEALEIDEQGPTTPTAQKTKPQSDITAATTDLNKTPSEVICA